MSLVPPPLPPIADVLFSAWEGGMDIFLGIRTELIPPSGIPVGIRQQFPNILMLGFEGAYNKKRNAQWCADGFVVDLSFDQLYPGCLIPWDAIVQAIVKPSGPIFPNTQPSAPDVPERVADESMVPDQHDDMTPYLRLVIEEEE